MSNNRIFTLSPLSCVEIHLKMIKLCLNKDNSAFLSFPSAVFYTGIASWWLWKELVCWRWDENAYLEMDRVTVDARVTTIGSYAGKALGDVRHRLTDVFLCMAALPRCCTGWLSLINRLRLRLEFMVLFQHGAPNIILFNEAGIVR